MVVRPVEVIRLAALELARAGQTAPGMLPTLFNKPRFPGFSTRRCSDADYGGYGDWYLPSGQELIKLFETNLAPLLAGQYWSSSEATPEKAFMVDHDAGGTWEAEDKSYEHHTWCIRQFTTPK